jgi:hypothetical protein
MSTDGKDLYRVIDDHFCFSKFQIHHFWFPNKEECSFTVIWCSHITGSQWKLISRLYGFSRDEFALAMRKGHTSALVMMDFKCEVPLFSRQRRLGNEIVKIGLESNESRSSLEWNTKGNDFSVKYQWQPVLSLSLYNPGVDVCKLTTREGIRQQLIYY